MTNEIAHQIEDAMDAGKIDKLRELFNAEPSRLHALYGDEPWLYIAAWRGQFPAVKILVELGIDINRRGGLIMQQRWTKPPQKATWTS